MNDSSLRSLLEQISNNDITIDTALKKIKEMYFLDLGFAKIDTNREIRKGFPEVIYCSGKTVEQIVKIAQKLFESSTNNILATRAEYEVFKSVSAVIDRAEYNSTAKMIVIRKGEQKAIGNILILTAGTSDISVAEEAAVTAEAMGNKVVRLYDTGVAGIHRLLTQSDKLYAARVIIVVAGMDGALPSVVGGLVDKPVIAVPTSIGYGANFGGLSALLAMLNSCSAGVGVVNIDNGFGAGYLASLINHLGEK